ncbi:MAG: hypothetical protein J7M05_00610 [Anaerolineae bacterium]|nr:hypothetical protein [Anaerolineae bacterium]
MGEERERQKLLFFYRRKPRRPRAPRVDPQTLIYFGVMLLLIGLAGWLYLNRASEVAAYAARIRALEEEKERLRQELVVLRARVAVEESLERTQKLGEELGYRLPRASEKQRYLWVVCPAGRTEVVEVAKEEPREQQPIGNVFQRWGEQFREWLATSPAEGRER